MHALIGPILLFCTAAAGVACAATALGWWLEPGRRALRSLAARLGGQVDATALAPRRGQGVGLRVDPPGVAVVRHSGDPGLVFGFEELLGAELIFDGVVRARSFRDGAKLPLDATHPKAQLVLVRLVFDDVRYPDYELTLLHPDDAHPDPAAEVARARRLFAHLEAVIRQPAVQARSTPEPAPLPDTTSDLQSD